jgi:hypothetical protein
MPCTLHLLMEAFRRAGGAAAGMEPHHDPDWGNPEGLDKPDELDGAICLDGWYDLTTLLQVLNGDADGDHDHHR